LQARDAPWYFARPLADRLMRLRRVDIHGFKSFRARTAIEIADGVTAVVGPNGCGKSNIVDAIRWSLGSQSPRDLRGRAMDDVIFAGSEAHAPSGLAEVSLTLENDGRDLPGEWRDVPEVKVTRRLFRTGESEYEINGARVRLRDVQSLFLGTGVGAKEAYSIIEQGRIGFIVSARPEERRTIIEEAAGITRYRYQRRTAERRLERTRDNLTRIRDILGEVERQLGALERQAARAAKHRELTARHRVLAVTRALHRRDRVRASLDAALKELEAARRGAAETATKLVGVEGRVETGRVEVAARERQLNAATETAYELRTRAELLANNVLHRERELERVSSRIEAIDRERASLSERVVTLEAEGTASSEARERLTAACEDAAARQTAAEAARKDASAARDAVADRAGQAGRQLTTVRGTLARMDGRLDSLGSELEALGERLQTSDTERNDAVVARDAAQAARDDADAVARAAAEAATQTAERLEAARTVEREGRGALDAARSAQRAAVTELEDVARRLQGVERWLAAGSSLGRGARAVLQAAENGELTGVLGALADRLRVTEGAEPSLGAALGADLDALIVTDLAAARAAARLARTRGASVDLIVLGDGVQGELAPWCTAVEPVPDRVAARIRAAQRVDDALDDAAATPRIDDARTHVDADAVRVGAGAALAAEQAVAQARERDELVVRRDAADEAAAAARTRVAGAEDALERALTARVTAEQAADAARRDQSTTARALSDADHALSAATRRVDAFVADIARLTERRDKLAEEREKLVVDAAEAREQEAALATEVEGAREALDAAEATLATARDALAEIRVESARLAEQRRSAAEREQRAADALTEARHRVRSLDDEQKGLRERLAADTTALQRDREGQGTAQGERVEAERTLVTARDRYEAAVGALRELDAERLTAQKAATAAASKAQHAELQAERARAELEHAEQGLAERFGVSVSAARHEALREGFTDEIAEELQTVERRLERMGPVNPAAEDEFREARERHEFLTTQQNDLEAAMADLETAIRRMDKTSRELFAETFERVNERFQAIFPRLFRGGRARLDLTNPDDLLETGVDISVQPPGKRLQSMTLLSGGEKALSAVALIFAIFELKPTPFCILDEVDAPLDEGNVARFADLVAHMSATSQFLLITHNKRSMEAASTLYGVTMEQPGVSRIVGVRLQGPADDAAPGAG